MFDRKPLFKGFLLSLLAVSVMTPVLPSANAAPQQVAIPDKYKSKVGKLKLPKRQHAAKKTRITGVQPSIPNTLVIMPNADGGEDAMQKLREVNGTIVQTIGSGRMLTWVVQFENTDQFLKAEKALVNDKNFKSMQRDYLYQQQAFNDPYGGSQWYIPNMNVEAAWTQSFGSANRLGIIDSGTNPKNADLVGKIDVGFDGVTLKFRQKDVNGHGTMVATTAAARADNGLLTAGPARNSIVYPVRVGFASGIVSTSAIIKGIEQCGLNGVKIINISSNGKPEWGNTFSNPSTNAAMHVWFNWYNHDKGGLCFNSAGNDAQEDLNPRTDNLLVVSAIDESNSLAYFSNWGTSVWFTAPGARIACSTRQGRGKFASVSGTSFSSPLVASIAALIWGASPGKTRDQILTIMVNNCDNSGGPGTWNDAYGWGRPDAGACMYAALH